MKWSALQRMGGPTVDEAKRFPMGAHHDAYSRKIRIFAGCTPQENAREEQFEWLFLVWVLCLIFYFTVLPISRLTAMTTGLDGDVRRDVNKIPVFFQGMVFTREVFCARLVEMHACCPMLFGARSGLAKVPLCTQVHFAACVFLWRCGVSPRAASRAWHGQARNVT